MIKLDGFNHINVRCFYSWTCKKFVQALKISAIEKYTSKYASNFDKSYLTEEI